MAKSVKTRLELEQMIVAEVRRHPRCERFQSITLYYSIFEDAQGVATWATAMCNYGEAAEDACEAVLREIIPLLQCEYDMVES
jgi:hypothetical protein